MSVTVRSRIGGGLAACLLASALLACSEKKKPDPPPAPVPSAVPAPAAAPAPEPPPADTHPAPDTVTAVESPPPGAPVKSPDSVPRSFRSRPPVKAWPGRAFAYAPRLTHPAGARLRLVRGPDSMVLSGNALAWTPRAPGSHAVVLEAAWPPSAGGDTLTVRQAFTLEVAPVLSLVLAPLPAQAGKDDTLVLDLRGTSFPDWAGPSLTVRFDYEGDGTWDTPALPLVAHLNHRHAWPRAGRFAPRVEARYLDLEIREARAAVTIVGAVDAALRIAPDTAEPGAPLRIDASASKGDGRLVYLVDLDGDGKNDWSDSAGGRGTAKAPRSGRYEARLTVRNATGQEGRATAAFVVDAAPRLNLKLKQAKADMATPVEILLEGIDTDDSLAVFRARLAGGEWTAITAPDTTKGPGKWRKTLRHAFGKAGRHAVEACVVAADGRSACRKAEVEIFNAPPVCEAGADVRATLGVPAEIEGKGRDPDGSIVKWEWDLDGDGRYDVASGKDGKVKYTFARTGTYTLGFRVTTADGATATSVRKVEVRKKWKS